MQVLPMEKFLTQKMAARAHKHRACLILSPTCTRGKVLTGMVKNHLKCVKIDALTPFFR